MGLGAAVSLTIAKYKVVHAFRNVLKSQNAKATKLISLQGHASGHGICTAQRQTLPKFGASSDHGHIGVILGEALVQEI